MVKSKPPMPSPEKYTYRVIWSEADQEYVGLVAEFPSLSWLEPKQGDALRGITKLVGEVLADMVKAKEVPPLPLSLQEFKGRIALRVPPQQHRALAMEAAEQGVSVNRLISLKLGA